MKNEKKSIRYKGLTRLSATFSKEELNDLKEVAQQENLSQTNLISFAIALFLQEKGKARMMDRVALLVFSDSRKGIGGGNSRKPVKKVTRQIKGVKVVVKGEKHLIGQTEMKLK